MIITETFVWINYPKSGSTFVRRALRELYKDYGRRSPWSVLFRPKTSSRVLRELRLPERRLKSGVEMHGKPTPHATVSQIPPEYRNLRVATSFRSPFERLKSSFRYGNWRKPIVHRAPLEEILDAFPGFPNLSFSEYAAMLWRFDGVPIRVGGEEIILGPLSADFLKFFSLDYIDPDTGRSFEDWTQFEESIAPVHFIDQERLNAGLVEFLNSLGHRPEDTAFILEKKRQNISKAPPPDDAEEERAVRELIESDEVLTGLVERFVMGKEFSFRKLRRP